MANSAERDVILRLKVVPDKGAEAAVNKTIQAIERGEDRAGKASAKRADASQKAADKAAAAAEKAAEKAAIAAEKAAAREAAAAERVSKAAQRERERQAREAERTYDREATAAQRAYSRIMRSQEQERAQVDSLTDQRHAYGVASKQAGLDAAEGAITAARGFAELGLLSEESTDKLLRKLIAVKAGFDVLQGGFKIWKGLIEWIDATTKATQAAAAAQEILNAAQARGAVTGAAKAGGAAASAAGSAAAGAAGSAAGTAAVSGGIGAAAAAFKGLGVVLGKVAVAATAALAINELVAYLGRIAGFDWESPTLAFMSWSKASKDLEASEERLAKAESDRAKRQEAIAKKAEDQRAFDALIRSAEAMQAQMSDLSNAMDEGTAAGVARRKADAEGLAGREAGRLGVEQADFRQSQASGGIASRAGIESANERVVAAQQRVVDIQREQVKLAQDALRNKQDSVRAAEQEVQVAKKAVAEERARYQTTLARFGALKETEQAELRAIAARVKAGEQISAQEAKFLQGTGIGGAVAEKALASAGGAAGGADVLSAFGENQGMNDAVGNLAAAEGQLTARQAELAAETLHLNDAMKTLQDDAIKLGEAFNNAIRFLQEPLTNSQGQFGNGQGPIQVTVPQNGGGSPPSDGGSVADAANGLQSEQQQTQQAALAAFDAMAEQQKRFRSEWESRRAQIAAVSSSIS